jgi:ABC-type lipoprotein export system ATPase subunit
MEGSSMTEALVRADSLARTYGNGTGRVIAVRDATFTVTGSSNIALVGPSGSGKSTLLHLIAGLDEPTTGSIEWPDLGEQETLRPGPVTIAFQGPSLLPPLTVSENVALPMLLAGREQAEASVAAAHLMDVFEVGSVASKLPEELSGGQAQRAGIARAFCGSPRLVLADEPTGQQDAETGARLLGSMLALAGSLGAALVVATHDAAVAGRLETRWTMRDGTLRTEARRCSD